ncbi:MAG: response regulator [Deltaproteobacteria bacterium]|nr:response regulator [Deltaproteobacteria bacterium]
MKSPVVLLADDEVGFVETLSKRLRKRDLSVVTAHSGQEALENLGTNSSIDVVVLDIKMPGMDGIVTLNAIKRLHPLVEVILLTGHATVESAIEGMKLGAFDYLRKPVDFELLLSKINAVQEKTVRTDRLVSLGRLAATVAHEINNPLSVVLTYIKLIVKLIERDRFTPERLAEVRQYLTYMEQETSRCGEIAKNLLSFARQSKSEIVPESIVDIIHRTLLLVSYDFKHRNVQLLKELADELPLILCDANQIQQALLNLLQNAAEAMSEGGTITVEAQRSSDAGFVEVVITDTGCGIPAARQNDVFEAFFTTKEKGKGVGLGLAVVKSIITRHQGFIEVESPVTKKKSNPGTRFRIRLPIARQGGTSVAAAEAERA